MRQMLARSGRGRAFGAIVVVAAIIAVTLGIGELGNGLPAGFSVPASAQRPESPVPGTHHVRIGGVEYHIPTAFWAGDLEPGLDQETILLHASYPGFTEPTPEQRRALFTEPGWGDRITVLITSGPFPSPVIPRLWQNFSEYFGPFVEADPLYHFQHFVPADGTGFGYDLFRPTSGTYTEELVLCRLPTEHLNASCQYYHMIDGAYLNIRFSRDLIVSAEQIRDDVLVFVRDSRAEPRRDTTVPGAPRTTAQ